MSVLVLGGSCFIGRHFVLLLEQAGITPVCINRGNLYWGDPRSPAAVGDRFRNRRGYCESIRRLISDTGSKWLGVVDFCAYEPRDITESLPVELFSIMPVYIFISTDSVYEVCEQIDQVALVGETVTGWMNTIPCRDQYGWQKLECEKTLTSQPCRSVFLRLPDVLGEFDDTYRLWGLWLWVKSGLAMKIENPTNQIVSFCYAKDVAKILVDILTRFFNAAGAFNIACDEDQWTISKFVETVAKGDRVKSGGHRMRLLPSVDFRRAALDCSRARNELGFNPTPLVDVLRKMDDWFSTAEEQFKTEFIECIRDLPRRVSRFYRDQENIPMSDSD